tara:strand:- start:235 stop:855 length:621 start_codon:yes stop_codon:yes gene_type:complete
MKKIVTILFTSLFLMSTAYAGGMIGVKAGMGDLEGTRTSSVDHGAKSGSVDSEYAAIFGEVNLSDNVSLGLELVPMEGIIDTPASTGTDSQVTVQDLKTLYVLASKETSFGSVYGKLGYAHADISVKSNYGHTITNASDALEGPMAGIGLQLEIPTPIFNTVRLEATHTIFDDVKITSADVDGVNSEDRTGEADLTTFSISLARAF